jgi:O-antigen ligase
MMLRRDNLTVRAPLAPRISAAVQESETPFNKAASWMLAFVVALTITGYPLAGSLAALLNVESELVTIPYRAAVGALTVACGAMVLARGRFTLDPLMSLFLLAYGVRLYYDLSYTSLPDVARSMAVYFSLVVLPFFAISIARYYYVNRRTMWAFVLVTAPSILTLMLLGLSGSGVMGQGGGARFGFTSLNPVSISYTGLYCVVAIFFLWREVPRPVRYGFLAPLALAAGYIMVLANARGGIVGLILCLGALSVRKGRTMIVLAGGVMVLAVLFGDMLSELSIFRRLAETGTDMSSLERFDRMRSSIELTIANPYFGFGYVENRYYSFPHNLLIEAGLALGIGGLAIMLYLQIRYGLLIWAGVRGNAKFVAMLGIIGLSSAWISSTLWASITFWTPMTLLIALAAEQRLRQRGLFTWGYDDPTAVSEPRRAALSRLSAAHH